MRGVTLTGQRRLDEALQSVSRAIELAPRHVNAVLSRADLYISFERFDEALVDLDRCFELLEGPGVRVDRARWPRANANQPDSDLVIRRRNAISLMLHPTDEALQQTEQAMRQSPRKARY